MQALQLLQMQVASYLKQPQTADATIIQSPKNLSAQQSINIYGSSIKAAFLDVLTTTFPVCKKIVGDEFFKNMAKCYIDQQASFSTNIDHYGKFFPEFIRNFSPTQSLPYLGDTAELEWLLQCVAEGEDYISDTLASLQDIPVEKQPNIIFNTANNSILFSSAYPIHKIWEFNQDTYTGPEQLHLDDQPCFLIIWRPQDLPLFEVITESQWQLLTILKNKVAVADLCAHFSSIPNFDIENNLSFCVKKGWINSFSL
jgi:hypothetical protein